MIKKVVLHSLISAVVVFAFPLRSLADDASPTNTPATDPGAPTDSVSASGNAAETLTPLPEGTNESAAAPENSNNSSTATQSGAAPSSGSSSSAASSGPSGSGSSTYTFNPDTGLWENEHYTWDPATQQTKPKSATSYSYNPATGMWDTTEWVFDSAAQKYVPNVVSVAQLPAGITALGSSIENTGPGSTNTVSSEANNNGFFNLFYDASISNKITGTAISGNAAVQGNTLGGDALTGNALNVNNILNILQSTWNIQPAGNLLTFTKNIDGNVVGDILIDPAQITSTGPLSVNNSQTVNNTNLTVNARGSGLIDNEITLASTSGNATVADNTRAGSATTGNANAVADVVNVLNSAIAAGQSFLGVININGNLDGDILLPPNFLDQLIASNAPRATINTSQIQNTDVLADITNTQTINNNVNLSAASGSANVSDNTRAGNATTGNANTNLTIFNLTGRQVIGTNSLLVFVNVLGSWVGLIMDAPAGSTAAALCGGNCQSSTVANYNATINSDTRNTINNDIDLTSRSGDANVQNNSLAGNARSGNASSSANLLNIINSNFSFSDWLGILFINVLGAWHGSFGVNTDAGNPVAASAGAPVFGPSGPKTTVGKVFRFVPAGNNKLAVTPLNAAAVTHSAEHSSSDTSGPAFGFASSDGDGSGGSAVGDARRDIAASSMPSGAWMVPILAGLAVALLVFGAEAIPGISDRLHVAIMSRRVHRS